MVEGVHDFRLKGFHAFEVEELHTMFTRHGLYFELGEDRNGKDALQLGYNANATDWFPSLRSYSGQSSVRVTGLVVNVVGRGVCPTGGIKVKMDMQFNETRRGWKVTATAAKPGGGGFQEALNGPDWVGETPEVCVFPYVANCVACALLERMIEESLGSH